MISTVLSGVRDAGLSDPFSLSDKEPGSIIYPQVKEKEKPEPDFRHISREMKKKGITLFLLREENKVRHPEGCMYSRFCAGYREYLKQNSVYMRKVYKAGEQMPADRAGLTMKYNGEDGNEKTAYVFTAALPAGSMPYARPFAGMKMESRIEGHVNAFE
jgi:transposase